MQDFILLSKYTCSPLTKSENSHILKIILVYRMDNLESKQRFHIDDHAGTF